MTNQIIAIVVLSIFIFIIVVWIIIRFFFKETFLEIFLNYNHIQNIYPAIIPETQIITRIGTEGSQITLYYGSGRTAISVPLKPKPKITVSQKTHTGETGQKTLFIQLKYSEDEKKFDKDFFIREKTLSENPRLFR